MLKGRQKNLDKNKDGKITGEDFKMMKAKYGKMMKAKKGVMAEDELKTLEKIAKVSIVGSGALAGAQATAKEMKELMKQVPKKSMGGKMVKAKKGVMAKSSTGKMEEDKYSKYVRSIKLPEPGDIFKEMKTPYLKPKGKSMGGEMKKPMKAVIGALAAGAVGAKVAKKLMQKKKEASAISPAMNYLGDTAKKSMGGEMKSTQGYGAARTSGMGLQDEDLIPGKSMDYYKDLM